MSLAERTQDELRELVAAIEGSETDKDIVMEAADVAILLHRIADTLGFDLGALVDEKMTINRARERTLSGDGTGQHS